MKTINRIIFTTLFSVLCISLAHAQTTVEFNLNMKHMLKDSVFVPGRDMVKITGNLYPLIYGKQYILTDTSSPADSIYSVEIDFNARAENQTLQFNYILELNGQILTETTPRSLRLQRGDIQTPAVIFNAFAW